MLLERSYKYSQTCTCMQQLAQRATKSTIIISARHHEVSRFHQTFVYNAANHTSQRKKIMQLKHHTIPSRVIGLFRSQSNPPLRFSLSLSPVRHFPQVGYHVKTPSHPSTNSAMRALQELACKIFFLLVLFPLSSPTSLPFPLARLKPQTLLPTKHHLSFPPSPVLKLNHPTPPPPPPPAPPTSHTSPNQNPYHKKPNNPAAATTTPPQQHDSQLHRNSTHT